MNNIITKGMIFNCKTLNIFTDASIEKIDGETIGCAGNNIVVGDTILEQPRQIFRNTTNNNSEIRAIYMAVINALKYRDVFETINIFSDSKICVFGLREWIFNWIKKSPNDVLISSQDTPVANQDIILRIVYFILNHNLKINLYHIRGHINVNNPDQLLTAKETFIANNHIQHDVHMNVIQLMTMYNDQVDHFTRKELAQYTFSKQEKLPEIIRYFYMPFDNAMYSKLIGAM